MTADFLPEIMQTRGRWRSILKALKEESLSTQILYPAKKLSKIKENLCIYQIKVKTNNHTKMYTQMFIAPLFIIAKNMETTQMPIN